MVIRLGGPGGQSSSMKTQSMKTQSTKKSQSPLREEEASVEPDQKKKKRKKHNKDGEKNKEEAVYTEKFEDEKADADVAETSQEKEKKEKKKKKKKHKKDREESTSALKKKKKVVEAVDTEKSEDKKTDADVAEPSHKEKKKKRRVSFAEYVEFAPTSDAELDKDNLVRGKRFSPEEDQMIMDAVHKYIEINQLGDEGLTMVLQCKKYPRVRLCWQDISSSLPWRPLSAVYNRAHILFERSEKRGFTDEEMEFIKKYHAENGPKWKELAEIMGKQRIHVKDAYRRIRLPEKRGHWSQDEYQNLFDLVNLNLRLKAFTEKKKNCMLREDISWEAISDKLPNPRSMSTCCHKWYDQLASPLVREGVWADTDDYLLLDALQNQDGCCVEDVEWDALLDHRDGDICKKRWNQMVRHIGTNKEMLFIEQIDVLAQRYAMDVMEYRPKSD